MFVVVIRSDVFWFRHLYIVINILKHNGISCKVKNGSLQVKNGSLQLPFFNNTFMFFSFLVIIDPN